MSEVITVWGTDNRLLLISLRGEFRHTHTYTHICYVHTKMWRLN